MEHEKGFEEVNNKNLHWKKWHPGNGGNFCPTEQMSHAVKNEKQAKCKCREVCYPPLPSATALPE